LRPIDRKTKRFHPGIIGRRDERPDDRLGDLLTVAWKLDDDRGRVFFGWGVRNGNHFQGETGIILSVDFAGGGPKKTAAEQWQGEGFHIAFSFAESTDAANQVGNPVGGG
jgi:hypothetical protein